jgi:hypothetical protein
MLKTTFFLTLMGLSSVALAIKPAEFDVLGIKPGMTAEQALAAMKSNGSQFTFTAETRYRDIPGLKGGGLAQMYYCDQQMTGLSCPGENVSFAVGMATKVVYQITRKTYVSKLSEKAVRDALQAKYGDKPHLSISNSPLQWNGIWAFDPNGNPFNNPISCTTNSLTTAQNGCGLTFRVFSLASSTNLSLNGGFGVEAQDHVLLMKEIVQQNAAQKAAAEAEVKRATGAGGPKL